MTTSMLRHAIDGAARGAVATAPMTAVMATMHWLLPRGQRVAQEPRQIVERLLRGAGVAHRLGECRKADLTMTLHFGYGMAAGAVSSALLRRPTPLAGAACGLILWAAGYCGWLPAAGILPPPHRRPAGRNALLIAAHVVWGVALAMPRSAGRVNPPA